MKFPRSLLAAATLAVTASFAQAATPTVVPTIPTKAPGSVAVLLGVDSVRKELHLTSLQRAVLNDIRTDYRDSAREIVAKAKDDLESKKRAQVDLDALTARYDRRALRVLSDDQRQRLTEIEYQIRGGYELLSPSLQRKLGLTAEQKAKIAKIYIRGEEYTSKVNAKFEKGKISPYQRLLDLRENRLDRSDDFLAVLTAPQYEQFEKLAGAKIAGGLFD